MCEVLEMGAGRQPTSVSGSQSATQGNALDRSGQVHALLPPDVQIGVGDILELRGVEFTITSTRLRFDVFMQPDHIEARGIVG